MKKWKRKLLLAIALCLFFTIAPALVFYAIGYRYDFKNKSFRKIGMIIIESKPENANIFINTKFQVKTPGRIKNLLPGEYDIKVEKENFVPWEKKLYVDSKKVTWASNIKLFYQKPEITTLSSLKLENFDLSPDDEKIIAGSKDQKSSGLWLINTRAKGEEKIYPLRITENELTNISEQNYQNITFSNFLWSPDSKKIIFLVNNTNTKNNEYILINDISSKGKLIPLNSLFDLTVTKLQWKNNNELYLLDESKNLYLITLDQKLAPKTIANNIREFIYNDQEGLVYLVEEENELLLIKENNNKKEILMHLPKNENFKIKIAKNYVGLLSSEKKKLYLINSQTKEIKLLGENIKDFEWSKEKNKLTYFNENEVLFYVPNEKEDNVDLAYEFNETNLLTRYSQEIKNNLWYPDEEHLTLLSENFIKIIEIDGRDKKNYYELKDDFKAKNYNLEFDKKGENIYFIDEKAQELLKINITKI